MVTVSDSLLASTKRTLDEVTVEAVGKLSDTYGFPLDEALQKLSIESSPRPRKKALISRATLADPRCSPCMPLPFCGTVVASWCQGIRYNRGLFTQCSNVPGNAQSTLCSTCAKVSTRPVSCGNIAERSAPGWRDRRGRKPVSYSVVLAKLGITRSNAEAEAAKFGWVIPESEFTEPGPLRRGRPPKEKPVVASVGDSLLDQLVEGARAMTITPPKPARSKTQVELFHRLFGSDSDSDLDVEASDVVPVFIEGTEYLHCATTNLVYDLHTQQELGKLSSEGRLVGC